MKGPTLVWVCPNGEILIVPEDRNHFDSLPSELHTALTRWRGRQGLPKHDVSLWIANRMGYFRGGIEKEVLYITEEGSRVDILREPQREKIRANMEKRKIAKDISVNRGLGS